MKYEGEVGKLDNTGDEANVEIVNVKRSNQAGWREYQNGLKFNIPLSMQKSFLLGRRIKITVEPK